MLKNCAIRRIMTSTLAFVIVSLICIVPMNKNEELKTSIEYVSKDTMPIYLLDKNNYLARTTIAMNNETTLEKAREIIEALIVNNNKEKTPEYFEPIIPKNTRLLEISLDNNLLKLNFSKEFLNINKDLEEKMIESLIYSLTEIDGIEGIMIFIEGKKLEMIPQSKIKLPNVLDRSFGINKIYDITNIKDISKTTIYYIGEINDLTYYIPVTKIDNNKENKIEIIIEELKSSPIHETNLMSYLASNVELLGYEALENQITLSFNNAILSGLDSNTILEEVKYSISLSLKDSLNAEEVIFKVDDQIIK